MIKGAYIRSAAIHMSLSIFFKSHSIVNSVLFPSGTPRRYGLSANPTSPHNSVDILSTLEAGFNFPCLFAECPSSGRVMLYMHGNATNLFEDEKRLEHYAAEVGLNVMAPEYPGYGPAQGRSTEDSIDKNAAAALRWILDKGFIPQDIILYGCSIGSGAAVKLAAELCIKGTPPGALILQSAYTSINDAVQSMMGPYASLLLLPRWRSLDRIRVITCPTLFIHGEYDLTIPPEHSAMLYSASPAGFKQVVLLPADHNSLEHFRIVYHIKDFLGKSLGNCVALNSKPLPHGSYGLTTGQHG